MGFVWEPNRNKLVHLGPLRVTLVHFGPYRKMARGGWRHYARTAKRVGKYVAGRVAEKAITYTANQAANYAKRKIDDALNVYVEGGRSKSMRMAQTTVPRAKASSSTSGGSGRRNRRSRHHTRGYVGRRFRKRVRKRMNKFLSSGCIRKRESGTSVSDPNAVYIGHSSFGAYETLEATMLAVARMFATKAGEGFTSFSAAMGGDVAAPVTSGYTWRFNYRTSIGGAVVTSTQAAGAGESWGRFGQRLGELICATMFNGGTPLTYFELVDVQLFDAGAVGSNTLSSMMFSAEDIKLHIVGNSNLQVQNRTLATSIVGDGDNDQADHIANNPIIGKRYKGYGTAFPYKWNADFTAPSPMFQIDQFNGTMAITVGTLTDLPATMSSLLNKPPPHGHFHNLVGSAYERVDPGKIRRSQVKHSYKMSLASFCRRFLPYMRTAATYAGLVQDGAHQLKMGKTNIFGFEKLCNSRLDEPSLSVGFECNLTTSAVAYARKRLYCAPQVIVV